MKNVKKLVLVILVSCLLGGSMIYSNDPFSNKPNQLSEFFVKESTKEDLLNTIFIEKFVFPLPDKYKNLISSYSGYRENSKLDTGGSELQSNMHYGIDYACPDKTPVYAAKDGYVTTVYPGYYNGPIWKGDKIYGGMIIIHHYDKTSTLYGHLSMTYVKEGTYVSAGDNIGLSGGVKGRRASGTSTGAHLHFAIFYDLELMFR